MPARITARVKVSVVLVCLLAASCGLPALASEPEAGISIGTSGFGVSVAKEVRPGTTVRLEAGTAAFGRSELFDNTVIDVQARLRLNESFRIRAAGAYLERRLRNSPLALVGGAVLNGNSISAVSVPSDQSVTISGVVYSQSAAGLIFTNVYWARVAPYLGAALRMPARGRFVPYAELGGYYQGKARVDFNATGAILANQAQFQKYYDNERSQLTAELAPVQFYPVARFGVRIRL